MGDSAELEDVTPVSDLQRFVCVLFDEEDGDALGADVFDDVENLRNDDRGKAKRGFVQEQDFRLHHQAATDGKHLLFAAGECTRALAAAFFEAREEVVDVGEVFLVGFFAVVETAEFEVFFDGERREDAASFGNERDAASTDFVGRGAGDVRAEVGDFAAAGARAAADGVEQGGFARAVRADEGDDFSLFDAERDAFQCFYLAVVGVQVGEGEHQDSPR